MTNPISLEGPDGNTVEPAAVLVVPPSSQAPLRTAKAATTATVTVTTTARAMTTYKTRARHPRHLTRDGDGGPPTKRAGLAGRAVRPRSRPDDRHQVSAIGGRHPATSPQAGGHDASASSHPSTSRLGPRPSPHTRTPAAEPAWPSPGEGRLPRSTPTMRRQPAYNVDHHQGDHSAGLRARTPRTQDLGPHNGQGSQ
jgi:hypothetical protein